VKNIKSMKRKKDKEPRVFQGGEVYRGEVRYEKVNIKEQEEVIHNDNDSYSEKDDSYDNFPDSCLNDAGKLLKYYRSSTASNMVFVSDIEAAHGMSWGLKKLERIKRELRKMDLISYCEWDKETRCYFFYLL